MPSHRAAARIPGSRGAACPAARGCSCKPARAIRAAAPGVTVTQALQAFQPFWPRRPGRLRGSGRPRRSGWWPGRYGHPGATAVPGAPAQTARASPGCGWPRRCGWWPGRYDQPGCGRSSRSGPGGPDVSGVPVSADTPGAPCAAGPFPALRSRRPRRPRVPVGPDTPGIPGVPGRPGVPPGRPCSVLAGPAVHRRPAGDRGVADQRPRHGSAGGRRRCGRNPDRAAVGH